MPRFIQSSPVTFTLKGIPGLEDLYLWLSLPFSFMFATTLLGNSTILFLLVMESALDKPMYPLLAMLLLADLVSTLAMMPEILGLLWFGVQDISLDACLLQMFIIHGTSVVHSAVLVAMAFDYVAICDPLHYTTALTRSLVCHLGLVVLVKSIPLLLRQLTFCQTVIAHTYCDHMAELKMACGHTGPDCIYGLFVAILVVGLDCLLLGASYALILQAVLRLSSRRARLRALSTCSNHLSVILIAYGSVLFSALVHRFGHSLPIHIHILLANLYLFIPSLFIPVIFGVRTKEIRVMVTKHLNY
ncbi:LOW QUALITY PROTEIN: putative olfactory receptor 52P1 [Ornithorhynchus anatinus]|uniref:LOW QUALITY PROTEIN: putative olfactory receptor 52P1 n=1 Tax=Ornithorhynchus anatinus TaxID=9258 RepID=UPI0010A80292|nr:LOW QUALITY PROTEIN: putative olfactory receptor 52P1 [Ornithorhynchus anatinus]